MTRAFKQGFMDKMAELNKRAYELGSTSRDGLFGIRSTYDSFKPKDPQIGQKGGGPLTRRRLMTKALYDSFKPKDPQIGQKGGGPLNLDPDGAGFTGNVTYYTPDPGSVAAGAYPDMFYDNPDNWRPRTVDEQIEGYNNSVLDPDGLLRRVPLVEDGQFNSTYWKDNMDLANLQSDAIRRRRGAGKPMVFNKQIKRYRLPED